MSDSKPGPAIAETVAEVQGLFPTQEALQEAVHLLTTSGFDRADLSLPKQSPTPGEVTPEQGASNPITDTDTRQARTLGTSTAATIGAFAAAGVTVATGGAAALAAAAAAAAGVGSGAVAALAGRSATDQQNHAEQDAASRGELILSVRTANPERTEKAEVAMRQAGATKIAALDRRNAGLDAASWTG